MTRRRPTPRLSPSTVALGLAALAAAALGGARPAAAARKAQDAPAVPATPEATSPVAVPAPSGTTPELPPPPPEGSAPSLPMGAAQPLTLPMSSPTDHETVVGRWGIQARRLSVGRLSALPGSAHGPQCDGKPCSVELNELGVRHWTTQRYAWSLGLVLGAGGGSLREMGSTQTVDTYFVVGPTIGSSFLLANWHHLAVNAGPELELAFFLPSQSASKVIALNARGVVEGEVHMGFIGLPALSVGLQTGVSAHLAFFTKGSTPVDGQPATDWSVGMIGPTSLWDLVTKAFVRFYF